MHGHRLFINLMQYLYPFYFKLKHAYLLIYKSFLVCLIY